MPSTKSELDKLHKKITALSDAHAKLGKVDAPKELLKIIRFPGWTTPAERLLVHALLDVLLVQTQAIAKTHAALLAAAGRVSRG